MREVKNTNTPSVESTAGILPDVWASQLEECVQYARIQIRGTIEALDQILKAATEQGFMTDSQITEAAEVLDIARDAVTQVARGTDGLAEAFTRARRAIGDAAPGPNGMALRL